MRVVHRNILITNDAYLFIACLIGLLCMNSLFIVSKERNDSGNRVIGGLDTDVIVIMK